ncbi:sigma factor [Streptomyces sp. NPDC048556]|uniref:RNA polymerase sigma factor n=1 Tax=Streptomyces sp. NPDC048556 TaxID=3156664 RepID=UPI003438FBAC
MANSAMPAALPAMTPAQQLNERFANIYTQFQPRIVSLVQREVRGGNIHLAEDLTADAFYRAWLDFHKCEADSDAQLYNWLATLARRTVIAYYRAKKNTAETPADTGSWQYANREMDTGPAGTYTPAATGFRTATISHPGDSDPDPNEALRRVRADRPAVKR